MTVRHVASMSADPRGGFVITCTCTWHRSMGEAQTLNYINLLYAAHLTEPGTK